MHAISAVVKSSFIFIIAYNNVKTKYHYLLTITICK